jgi:hypothetical protein
MRSRSTLYYLQRKKVLVPNTSRARYETGTLHIHSRPVEITNPETRPVESPGTKFKTELSN